MTHSSEWSGNHGWLCDRETYTCRPFDGAGQGIYNTRAECVRYCRRPVPASPGWNCVKIGDTVNMMCEYNQTNGKYETRIECLLNCRQGAWSPPNDPKPTTPEFPDFTPTIPGGRVTTPRMTTRPPTPIPPTTPGGVGNRQPYPTTPGWRGAPLRPTTPGWPTVPPYTPR